MNIICTGISCAGRKELIADFEALCHQKEIDIGFFNVGDFMHNAAAASGIRFTERVLDSDPAVLSLARRAAFYEIASRADDYEHAVIGLHACFRWRGTLLEGISFKEIECFPPDLFINVVDNIADISNRMANNPQWSNVGHDTLNVWIDEEEFLTKQLANLYQKSHYTVARQHPLDNFYELIFSSKPSLYLSYPITILQETPEEIEEIRALGAKLREAFIVFDPLSIKDMALVRESQSSTIGLDRRIPTIDENVIQQIKTRTISRDYQFLHQSDFVVVIYPTDKLSPGVLSEMNYASRYNKPVYAVYSGERSIFFENLCERIFDNFAELVDFLNATYERRIPQSTDSSGT